MREKIWVFISRNNLITVKSASKVTLLCAFEHHLGIRVPGKKTHLWPFVLHRQRHHLSVRGSFTFWLMKALVRDAFLLIYNITTFHFFFNCECRSHSAFPYQSSNIEFYKTIPQNASVLIVRRTGVFCLQSRHDGNGILGEQWGSFGRWIKMVSFQLFDSTEMDQAKKKVREHLENADMNHRSGDRRE